METGHRFKDYVNLLAAAMGHADRHQPLEDYCRGLLLPNKRKSVEPIAAQVAPARTEAKHQSLLHFVGNGNWCDESVLDVVTSYVLPRMDTNAEELSLLVDDTGSPKSGYHSVGVARQYCGQLGKRANCQVAVTLSIATEEASLPIAHRLYLPQDWIGDFERRRKTKIPDDVEFLTKPAIALRQLQRALAKGIPRGIVNADSGYGNGIDFRDGVTQLGLRYILGIMPHASVYLASGEHSTKKAIAVRDVAIQLKDSFRNVTWGEGANGIKRSRFLAVRVRPAPSEERHKEPRDEEWLLVEWPANEKEPTRYWLSTLPRNTSVKKLVARAKLRWRVEGDYRELKQQVGFGDYEGRGWIGFHHHATLSIASYGFLMAERLFSPSGRFDPRSELQVSPLPRGYRPRGSPR